MPEVPVAPETANAVAAESAPAQLEVKPAATPESAPAASEQPTTKEAPKTTEAAGSEPEKEPEAVRELKSQRKKRQEAEAEAAYWRAEALKQQQAAVKPAEQAPQADPNAPQIEQFGNYDDYLVAKAKYEIKKEADDKQAEQRQTEVNAAYSKRFVEAAKRIPDLAETIESAQIPMPQPVIDAIKDAEVGPEMAYHLAKHPEEAEGLAKLAQVNPWAAMRELGKLEMRLKMPVAPAQTRQVTQAPEPIRPVGAGTSGIEKSPEEMSTAEFIAWRNSRTFARVGGRLVPKS